MLTLLTFRGSPSRRRHAPMLTLLTFRGDYTSTCLQDSADAKYYYYYLGFSVGEAACTRAHAAYRSRTEEAEVGGGLPPSRGQRPTGGGSAPPAPRGAKPRRARRFRPEGPSERKGEGPSTRGGRAFARTAPGPKRKSVTGRRGESPTGRSRSLPIVGGGRGAGPAARGQRPGVGEGLHDWAPRGTGRNGQGGAAAVARRRETPRAGDQSAAVGDGRGGARRARQASISPPRRTRPRSKIAEGKVGGSPLPGTGQARSQRPGASGRRRGRMARRRATPAIQPSATTPGDGDDVGQAPGTPDGPGPPLGAVRSVGRIRVPTSLPGWPPKPRGALRAETPQELRGAR
jgi:hypothetical protein